MVNQILNYLLKMPPRTTVSKFLGGDMLVCKWDLWQCGPSVSTVHVTQFQYFKDIVSRVFEVQVIKQMQASVVKFHQARQRSDHGHIPT